jgi:uncharacterized tellurite resistance protein B-like protein
LAENASSTGTAIAATPTAPTRCAVRLRSETTVVAAFAFNVPRKRKGKSCDPKSPDWIDYRYGPGTLNQWYCVLSLTEIKAVASLLMGAAHSDGSVNRDEAREVRTALEELFGERSLPEFLVDHLLTFNPATFDLATTCASLRLQSSEERRGLLELIARVIDADQVCDLAEDAYLRRVAHGIGASSEEFHDLVVDILE